MKKKITLAAFLASMGLVAHAAFVPVALTGFNEDVVANGSGLIASSVSADFTNGTYNGIDNDAYMLLAQDYVAPGGGTPSHYLPTGGLVTSSITSGLTFQLADYTANNALYLASSGDSGTLSFVTPQSAGAIYLSGLSAAGISTFNVTVNFSDGTSQTFTGKQFVDWYNTPPAASVPGIGRVSLSGGVIDPNVTSQNPHLFEMRLDLNDSNFSKNITSVGIAKTSTTGYLVVMGITANTVCTGTPTPGTITASISSGCSSYTSNLSMTGTSVDGGIGYQWQSSVDGVTFTNVSGATNATYAANVTANVYYRDSITCEGSGSSAFSDTVELLYTAPAPVIATLPFSEGFENWYGTCYTYDRPDSSITLSPVTGNNSWRRDDQGADASWTAATIGMYSPASVQGSHSARFHAYYANHIAGSMDLHIDLSTPGTKQISFFYVNHETTDNLYVELSEDGGTTFDTVQTFTGDGVGNWHQEVVNTNSVAANAVIRFEAWSDYGSYDQGMDSLNVVLLTPCAGTPDPVSITATQASGCAEYLSTLTIPVNTTTGGFTYQWLTSTDGGVTYSTLPGATSTSYQADVTATVYYKLIVTCAASGLSDTTVAQELQYVVPTPVYATLPYFQGFESWMGTCYNYDRPDSSWTTYPTYSDVSWRRDDQGTDAGWHYPATGVYTPASSEGSHSARFHTSEAFYASSQSGTLNLYADFSGVGTKEIMFDYLNKGDDNGFDMSNMTVSISTDSGATWTQLAQYGNNVTSWTQEVIQTDTTAPHVIIQFKGNANYDYGDMGIDSVSVSLLPACSGTPTAGTLSTSQASGCSEYTANLSLNNVDYTVSGLAYLWETSTDGTNFVPVTGATNTTYAADVTADVYYRLAIVCTNGNDTAFTDPIELMYVTPVATPATIPYFQSFESWMGTCYNYDRPDSSWLLTPVHGNASWRRDDQGTDAGWSYPTDYIYTPVSSDGSHSARFHSGWAYPIGSEGDMDLHIDLSTPGTKAITFDYINGNGTDYVKVELSEDSGATFTTLGTINTYTSSWKTQHLTTTSVAPDAIIRFAGISDYGSTDIGIDSLSIDILPACTGMPTAGTFTNTASSGCTQYTSVLTVDTPLYATGISYQWQSSPDSVTFTDIPGATGLSYTATVTASLYYRFEVICANSNDTDSSAAKHLLYTPEQVGTATVPYFQGFESWTGGACDMYDRPDTNWIESPTTGNDAWRRNDQGADANWTGASSAMYSPASTEGTYSARFHTWEASYNTGGNMDLHIDLSTPGTKQIQFDYNNQNGTDVLNVELSEDSGATFTTLATLNSTNNGGWQQQMINTTSTAAHAVIRFAAVSDFGSTDIGIDSLNIYVLPACSGQPTAGTLTATQTSGCSEYTSTLSVDAPINATGISYQWQSSINGGVSYSNITGATGLTYTADVTTTTYYRFEVVCASSNDTDSSAGVALILSPEVAGIATLPYFQGFENWTGTCYAYDRPDTNWLNNPNTGNTSWRRDDQGSDANWGYTPGGAYSPASSEGDHSARFHTYEVFNGGEGDLDLHVNLSNGGTKTITFDYNNDDGDDYLMVELSEDSGTTWDTLTTVQSGDYTNVYGWSTQTVTTASVSASAILRFAAISDDGYSDIGIDSLNITAPTCDTVTGLAVTGILQTTATATWNPVGGTAGYEVVVDQSSSDPTTAGTGTTSASYIASNLLNGTTYYVHVRDSCGPNSYSAWSTVSFTTLSCDSITGLTVSGISDHGAIVSWNPISGTAGYEYVIGTTTTAPATGAGTANTSVTDTTLAPSTVYYVFVRDSCGPNSFSAWDTLSFTTHPLGVADVNGSFDVSVYPNPANSIVTVRVYGMKGDNRKVTLTDVAGRTITTQDMATDRVDFNLSNLASGIYLVRYEDDSHTRVIKVNKQ